MATEDEWDRAREQFSTEDAHHRAQGRTGYPGGDALPGAGADHGPLVEQFALLLVREVLFPRLDHT